MWSPNVHPHINALANASRSWTAGGDDPNPWLMANFTHHIVMYSWYTLGRANSNQWVTAYKFDWTADSQMWVWILTENNEYAS